MKTQTITCDDCNILVINNHPCHELGCPSAWKGIPRPCLNCGSEFIPESYAQDICDGSCREMYWGY